MHYPSSFSLSSSRVLALKSPNFREGDRDSPYKSFRDTSGLGIVHTTGIYWGKIPGFAIFEEGE